MFLPFNQSAQHVFIATSVKRSIVGGDILPLSLKSFCPQIFSFVREGDLLPSAISAFRTTTEDSQTRPALDSEVSLICRGVTLLPVLYNKHNPA